MKQLYNACIPRSYPPLHHFTSSSLPRTRYYVWETRLLFTRLRGLHPRLYERLPHPSIWQRDQLQQPRRPPERRACSQSAYEEGAVQPRQVLHDTLQGLHGRVLVSRRPEPRCMRSRRVLCPQRDAMYALPKRNVLEQ